MEVPKGKIKYAIESGDVKMVIYEDDTYFSTSNCCVKKWVRSNDGKYDTMKVKELKIKK